MNLQYLTKSMWEVIRTWEYETIMKMSEMMQPAEEEYE